MLKASDLPAHFTQYADDTTVHDNQRQDVENTVESCEAVFNEDNLNLNLTKTQYVTATKLDSSWKSVKLLGSLLGSAEDVANRMSAANRAFGSISWQRHNLSSRLCMFNCLILPILLYNCGLWTLTKALSDKLDAWHRKKLRFLLGILHPHHIRNSAVYAQTNQVPISLTCRRRRLLWFGHVIREGEDSASFKALKMAINTKDVRKPRGRPVTRWVDNIVNDLKLSNVSLLEAEQLALDRNSWFDLVDRCVNLK